jgi:hypothetical protein
MNGVQRELAPGPTLRLRLPVSNGTQAGPPIGVQKGPLAIAFGLACPGSEQEGAARPRSAFQGRWRSSRLGGACLPTWAKLA